MDAQSDLYLWNFEARPTLLTLYHVPLAIPEQFLWRYTMHCPFGGHIVIVMWSCHCWSSGVFGADGLC